MLRRSGLRWLRSGQARGPRGCRSGWARVLLALSALAGGPSAAETLVAATAGVLPAPEPVARASRVRDPAPDPLASWLSHGELQDRALAARLAAFQLGATGFDAAARAMVLDRAAGTPAARARVAVEVSPQLPLSQAALARALATGGDALGAVGAAARSVAALGVHRDARLWLEAVAALHARDALFFGGLAFLALVALRIARPAGHDLGDRIARLLPSFARAGLLGLLVLLPAILGQGLLGVGVALFALAFARGSRMERRAAVAAAVVLVVGLDAGTRTAAAALLALAPDPVGAAAERIESGLATPSDVAALLRAEASDPLAARMLAVDARRRGRLPEARARYEALLADGRVDAALANNAGNVAMALGDAEAAVAHYELAASLGNHPVSLYNLSYGYGQAIRPSAQDETFRRLQEQDAALATELTTLQATLAGGYTVDLPLPESLLRNRAGAQRLHPVTAEALRRGLAPGVLGASPLAAAAAFLAAAVAGRLAARFRRSGVCRHCGARTCPRCDAGTASPERCAACDRLLRRPETADPERRERRLAELSERARRLRVVRLAAAAAIPGAAGVFADRPWLGLLGAIAGALLLSLCVPGGAALGDPMVAGGAAGLAAVLTVALALAIHALAAVLSLRARPEARA